MSHFMKVAIPVFPGVEELDAVGPFEVFGLARQAGLPVEVALVTHVAGGMVRGFHGMEFGGLGPFPSGGDFDVIVVPGGAWISGLKEGVRLAIEEGILPEILRQHFDRGAVVASVCTGAFLLEAAGLLSGVKATTHHVAREELRGKGVDVSTDRVVDAGRILTAGGITSGIDLYLHLVERFFGEGARIAAMLEYVQ